MTYKWYTVISTTFVALANIWTKNHYSPSHMPSLLVVWITATACCMVPPVTQIEKLQRIQKAAARLITRSPKLCHMGPIYVQLHWLPIRSRIHHKILTLTFKSIHGLAPSYLSELITTSRPSGYSLRSSQSTMLIHPPAKMLSTLGDRAFSTAAPQLWNRLPPTLFQTFLKIN